jgi:site-specific recombinase XerD
LCNTATAKEKACKAIECVIAGNRDTPLVVSAVAELLYINGARITEVLNIKGTDISSKGHIKIKGLKSSSDRILRTSVHKQFWLGMRNFTDTLGSVYSRFYFYREFKKRGISLEFKGYKNKAVTHAPRHLLISELQTIDKELVTTQLTLGHKSIKSTEHYDKKNR